METYTHLHVHTEYSLLDGTAKITELIAKAKDMGMTSLAITDHGAMHGVIDFYKAAHKQGIKPILGCEVYVATGNSEDARHDKTKSEGYAYTHLVLLAENNEGYHNLIKLVSLGYTEGFYYKPRVDIELLRKYNKGIIALSACLAGSIPRAIIQGNTKKAKEEALLYDEIYGRGNFFLELQNHGIPEQQLANTKLIELHKELGIPLVATNDVHYINQEDAPAHDVLICIQTNKTIADENRMRYDGDQFYLKSHEEMENLFSDTQEGKVALANTSKIADRCHIEIEFNQYKLPKYPIPQDQEDLESRDPFVYLTKLSEQGLVARYKDESHKHHDRLLFELNTIRDMGFSDYFLVVWDFIKYAKDNGIMVGPGRGSAAGSIVSYSLGITDVDPIRFGLVFERFLNPERISMPDIDIDFCYERRQEVIDYVINKYGSSHVAQIITFGTMAAKAAIRDVGRALAMPYADVDRVAKMIPFELGITLKRALELNPELKRAYQDEDDTANLIDMSKRLEGLTRHASTHAAGVVISDAPVDTYVPLYQNDGLTTTQFPMGILEELGLLKMDFLGLRTLTVIHNAVTEIKRNHNITVDFNEIGHDDPAVYKLISSGKTEGIFQLESSGMKSFIKELQPESIEDIIAGIALYRPGPMDFIPKYIRGRHSKGAITYTHPALEPILSNTYGCIVYQEQVMQIVRDLAGYSLSRSDLVRRAMSKKETDVMAKERQYFVEGCAKRGIDEGSAEQIFEDMSDFAKYAFNKSHAAAYAMIGYQTAWLKHYYPIEFMAATMTSVMDFTDKVVEYIQVCKKMNINLLPPDVNEGYGHFSVSIVSNVSSTGTGTGKSYGIRFGLSAIKNVGRGAISALVAEREANGPFMGLTDFIRRMGENANKRFVEGLIKAGAFDSLGGKRAQYMNIYKDIMTGISSAKKSTIEGQINLFEIDGQETHTDTDILPQINEFDRRTLLNDEKDALGLYISGHPLEAYSSILDKHITTTSPALSNLSDREKLTYGGMITHRSIKYTRAANKPMAFITVEDLYGPAEVIVFPQIYEKYGLRLLTDTVIIIDGQISQSDDDESTILADNIRFYDDLADLKTDSKIDSKIDPKNVLWLKIPKDKNPDMQIIVGILTAHPGGVKVKIYDEEQNKKFLCEHSVLPCDDLYKSLNDLLGEGMVKLVEVEE